MSMNVLKLNFRLIHVDRALWFAFGCCPLGAVLWIHWGTQVDSLAVSWLTPEMLINLAYSNRRASNSLPVWLGDLGLLQKCDAVNSPQQCCWWWWGGGWEAYSLGWKDFTNEGNLKGISGLRPPLLINLKCELVFHVFWCETSLGACQPKQPDIWWNGRENLLQAAIWKCVKCLFGYHASGIRAWDMLFQVVKLWQ